MDQLRKNVAFSGYKKKEKKEKEFKSGHTEILQCRADTGSLLKDTALMVSSVFDMRSAS